MRQRHTRMYALILAAVIDVASARGAFAELDAMCAADAGKLWGRTVCGPTLLVDPQSREAVTSEGKTIQVPESIGIANTSVTWDGRDWTMVMWPLPADALARRVLLAHESFHRIQKELGFPAAGPANLHLDSMQGRVLLRLEWRALARALTTGDKTAVADALAYRAERRALTKNAAEEERALEMHEGLAEHTGYALAEPRLRERAAAIAAMLAKAEQGDSFVRSFAYASGPPWGALIEMKDPAWTRKLKASDDLGELARRAWGVAPVSDRPREGQPEAGATRVREEERAREERKREQIATLVKTFVDGPVLTLPLVEMRFTFDPNQVQPLEGFGTVYPKIELSDVWGRIVVTGGGMISSDWKRLVVPANGDAWTLTLHEGWTKKPGARAGDFVVDNAQPK